MLLRLNALETFVYNNDFEWKSDLSGKQAARKSLACRFADAWEQGLQACIHPSPEDGSSDAAVFGLPAGKSGKGCGTGFDWSYFRTKPFGLVGAKFTIVAPNVMGCGYG